MRILIAGALVVGLAITGAYVATEYSGQIVFADDEFDVAAADFEGCGEVKAKRLQSGGGASVNGVGSFYDCPVGTNTKTCAYQGSDPLNGTCTQRLIVSGGLGSPGQVAYVYPSEGSNPCDPEPPGDHEQKTKVFVMAVGESTWVGLNGNTRDFDLDCN